MSRVLLLLFLLSTPLAWAQEEAEQEEAETETPTEDSGGEARDESPFDYQSSEQISEDLSVSFPVDI